MSVRTVVNRYPAVAVGAVIVAVLGCGWFAYTQVRPTGPREYNSAYYTIDDGKTWFADDVRKEPPFDRDGKPAVRVHLYRCNEGDDTPFVAYLERYNAKAKAIMEKVKAERQANPGKPPRSMWELAALGRSGQEFKRPGESEWVAGGSPALTEIVKAKCKQGNASEVLP